MAFITIDGENKIAFQQGNSLLLDVTHFVLANITGLGSEPVDRVESMPAVADIVDTRVVSKVGYVNTNKVVYSLSLDSTIGDYTFNWVGLKDADGVLIAAVYLPQSITKTATNGGIEGNNLVRNFLLQYSGIQATTAINAPASTWQIDFTTRLLQIDERERLSNLDIYSHEGFFGSAFSVVRQGATSTYDVLAGVGYVGGVRVESLVSQQVVAGVLPEAIWLDVSLQGDINGVDVVWSLIIDSAAHPDYTDVNGFNHYLTKLADLDVSGIVIDARIKSTLVADHEAKIDPHPQYLTQPEGDLLYKDINATSFPVGGLLIMDGGVVPNGFLKRNGAALSRTTYADLWAYAQTIANFTSQAIKNGDPTAYSGYYGDGDGSTTFTLPDARGDFIRAWDDGRGVDAGRGIGSWQADDIKSHSHTYYADTYQSVMGDWQGNAPNAPHFTTSNTSTTGIAENRVKNTAYLFCVKY